MNFIGGKNDTHTPIQPPVRIWYGVRRDGTPLGFMPQTTPPAGADFNFAEERDAEFFEYILAQSRLPWLYVMLTEPHEPGEGIKVLCRRGEDVWIGMVVIRGGLRCWIDVNAQQPDPEKYPTMVHTRHPKMWTPIPHYEKD